MRFIDQEQELRRELPKVYGNADYREYAGQLEEIDGLLIRSGIEAQFVAMRLAESFVLQRFCRVGWLEGVTIPSKSTLERYDKLAPEGEIRELVSVLLRMAGGVDHAGLGLDAEVGIDVLLADSTCLKANIHCPTDWVLLRDGVRTLMKAVKLIRREGLRHRMEEPETFLREINRLSIEMTQGRRAADSVKWCAAMLRGMC